MENIDYKLAIQENLAHFRSKKRRIAEFVLEHPQEVVSHSVQKLARLCDCDQTTIVRFAQQIGFSGISALKIAIARQSDMIWGDFKGAPAQGDGDSVLMRLARLHSDSITKTLSRLEGASMERLMSLLDSRPRTMTYGAGTSRLAAADLSVKFRRLGIECIHYEDLEMSRTFLNYLGESGILFIFSNSGETESSLSLARLAKQEHLTLIVVTSYPGSKLAALADICLVTDSRHEHPVRFGAMTSRIAQFAVVDAISLLFSMRDEELSWSYISKAYHETE